MSLIYAKRLLGMNLGASIVASSLCFASTSHAAPTTKEKCIADADEGQSLRDAGKLRDARARFVGCASSTCPGAVAKECSAWLADVEARLPSVVVSAVDGSGNDLVDVKVSLDGQPLLDRLTGSQTQVDPGPHRFRFETAGMPPIEETFVISERQKGRVVQAKFGAATSASNANPSAVSSAPSSGAPSSGADAESPPHRASPPVAAYIVGGAGVLALGSFAFFGLKGYSDYKNLKDSCDPNCAKSDTDSVKTKFLIADISLGVGVVALGVATYLFLAAPRAKESAHDKEERAANASLANHAVVTPVHGGWLAGYETRF